VNRQEKGRWVVARVPSHFIKQRPVPPETVKTMKVGDTRHITAADFGVDADHTGWINPDALVADEISKSHPVVVNRVKQGYDVDLLRAMKTYNELWDDASEKASFVEKGWIEVHGVGA
jgi:hypothetical protein